MNDIEKIDQLIKQLKEVKSNLKKQQKLSDKVANTDFRDLTLKGAGKMQTDLNFQCMYLDQSKVAFARLFKGSLVDVSTDEKIYRPSGFHEYKF